MYSIEFVLTVLKLLNSPMTKPTLRKFYLDLKLIEPPQQTSRGRGKGLTEAVFTDPLVVYKLLLARDLLKHGFAPKHIKTILSRPGFQPTLSWTEEQNRFDFALARAKVPSRSYLSRAVFRYELLSLAEIENIWNIPKSDLERFLRTFPTAVQRFVEKDERFSDPVFYTITKAITGQDDIVTAWHLYLSLCLCKATERFGNRITYLLHLIRPSNIVPLGATGAFSHSLMELQTTKQLVIDIRIFELDVHGRDRPSRPGRSIGQFTTDAAHGAFIEKIERGIPSKTFLP